MTKTMISAKDVWKRYGSQEVLKGLNLEVFEGETMVILGRSGAGKSVLLKQLMGLERPDKGTVVVDDNVISKMSQRQIFRTIRNMGMLFQSAALFDSMTVGENTAFYLTQHQDYALKRWLTPDEIGKRVKEALDMVGMGGTEHKMPADLSGGMRRRAALARLIVYRPRILLYDEPTAGLDPVTAMTINDLIRKTQKELKTTSIVVTHDLRSATEVGDRLALHHDGKIAVIAPKAEFFQVDDPVVRSFIDNSTLPDEYLSLRRKNA
jgi:phospholipid/cholesterol/gamma-HCH transport system ATP-binding protein